MVKTDIKIKVLAPEIPAKNRLLRVAAYARVSGQKDAMHHSLAAQISYYNNYIQNHNGWLFCGVYSDEAKTGTKDTRNNFQALLTEARAGKIDLIITKSISRFARNTLTLLETVRELKTIGVGVFFEEQNINTLDGNGELMMTILGSFAQAESLSASENQKWRIRKGFMNGELINFRFMFGYSITGHEVKINPDEAIIVQEIFRRAIDGDSLSSIADDLSKRGISGVLGGKISANRIRDILENEKYTGNALLMKHFRNNHIEKKEIKNSGEQPMYFAEGTHDAIIDRETFDKAQELLRGITEKTQHRTAPKRTEFTSLIQCGKCGRNYTRRVDKGLAYWNCQNYVRHGKEKCPGCRIHETMLREITESVAPYDKIRQIVAAENRLTFMLDDGSEISRTWELKSRAASWTDEMKQKAREHAIKQRSEN